MTAPPPRSMARLKAFQSRTLSSGDRMKSGVMVWLRCSCSLPLSLLMPLSQEGDEPLAVAARADERSALLSGDALLDLQDEQACSFFVDVAVERGVFELILP